MILPVLLMAAYTPSSTQIPSINFAEKKRCRYKFNQLSANVYLTTGEHQNPENPRTFLSLRVDQGKYFRENSHKEYFLQKCIDYENFDEGYVALKRENMSNKLSK